MIRGILLGPEGFLGCRLDGAPSSLALIPFLPRQPAQKKIQEVTMSDLVAIVYPTEAKAEEVRQRLLKLQKEYLISISDAVIAVKTESGGIKLNQLVNTTAAGAI